MEKTEIKMHPIGHVRILGDDPMNAEYFIDIHEEYRSALKELDQFSHLMVFWWAHGMDKKEFRKSKNWTIDVPYAEGAPKTGIFATRAEYRPNPIALTTCGILDVDVEKGVVKIEGIDAFDGTPIVDLKAYFPICDRVRNCHIAPWLKDWPIWVEDGIAWWQEQGFFEDEVQ